MIFELHELQIAADAELASRTPQSLRRHRPGWKECCG